MKKIIIIGAGPAGLTAAYNLLKQSKEVDVTILEETGEIGGISRTVKHNGNRMDIGGHRFFSKDEQVMKWWKNIMPVQGAPAYDDNILMRQKEYALGGPDPEQADKVMLIRQRVSRIFYHTKFFDYPISMKWDTFKNMGFKQTLIAGISYMVSVFHKRKEDCLENFYINRFGKVLYSMFFEGYTEKLWGRHPREIAADWGAQRVKGLSVFAVLKNAVLQFIPHKGRTVETSLIEEFIYPKFGPGQLWKSVADEIEKMGGKILRMSRVNKITCNANQVECICYSGLDGERELEVSEGCVISSMPLKDLMDGMAGQNIPEDIRDIAEGLPYRDFVTVGLLVPKLKLKNMTKIKTLNHHIPDCWIYVQDTNVKLGRIQIFNNWSPYMVKNVEETMWIGLEYFCAEGDSFWNMKEEECKNFVVDELIRMGVLDQGEKILDYHRELVKKAYPAYFDTYKDLDKLIEYLNQIENLYCIGRNGQHRYNNMDHSMATAFEAVDNILGGKATKENIWNVNTEKEYHEEAGNRK